MLFHVCSGLFRTCSGLFRACFGLFRVFPNCSVCVPGYSVLFRTVPCVFRRSVLLFRVLVHAEVSVCLEKYVDVISILNKYYQNHYIMDLIEEQKERLDKREYYILVAGN